MQITVYHNNAKIEDFFNLSNDLKSNVFELLSDALKEFMCEHEGNELILLNNSQSIRIFIKQPRSEANNRPVDDFARAAEKSLNRFKRLQVRLIEGSTFRKVDRAVAERFCRWFPARIVRLESEADPKKEHLDMLILDYTDPWGSEYQQPIAFVETEI